MNKLLTFTALLCCLLLAPLSTAAAETDSRNDRHFQPMDVFALQWVSDPRISPDGKRIVYARNSMDVMQDRKTARLWLMKQDGSGNQPLTSRDSGESGAAWSPDGSRIAFVSEGQDGSEIFVTWVDSGKTTRLTQLDRSPSGLTWSPDGEQIAFSMLVPEKPPVLVEAPAAPENAEWAEKARVTTRLKYERDGSGYMEPGFTQYFVLPALGGAPVQVSSGEFRHDSAPMWTADGNALLFSGNRDDNWELDFLDSEIYRLDLESREITALTRRQGPDANPVISPDGKTIAWTSFEDAVQTYNVSHIRVMDADGSNKRTLPLELDRSISSLAWAENSKGLYFQYDHEGDTRIAYTDLDGENRVVATNLGGTTIGRPYGGGSFSVADGQIAYTHVTPYRPAELAVVSGRRGEPNVVTGFSGTLLSEHDFGRVEEIWYDASTDDRRIQGWLVYPPDHDTEKNYPLLVENHGGPISNYGPRFSPEIQLYAAAGYIVFYPNPRGSTGYGEEFGNLLKNNYPGDDYQDVMDGVDHLIEKGIAHEGQLYVTGGSAGGIMTAWMIGKNNRFEAAAVIKPIMNWISKTLTADNYFQYANYRYPGQPWENIEEYMKFSPISLVGNVETPTLVMVGTDDLRTPISEAKQLYSALKIRDVDTALVELPGAAHNIANQPSQLIAKVAHILAWFDKYRLEEGSSSE